MWNYNYDELYHHGIKGQRWGVRRFQNEDGSLTPAGEKRYGVDGDGDNTPKVKKKSKYRLRVEENFKAKGMTDEEAEAAAKKRIRTQRILAASAAITVTACAAYLAKDKIKDRIGGVIKSGDNLQRVEFNGDGKLHDEFFVSRGKHDNDRYRGLLGENRFMQNKWYNGKNEAYLMKLAARENIKIASNDKAAKVFGDLYKNDPEFRQAVEKHVSSHFTGANKVDTKNLSAKNIRKMYDNFNAGLIDIRQGGSGADKKFYNKLKSAGYGAIRDINDMKYSGYNAKNPLIVFNNSNNNISVKSVRKMVDENSIKSLANAERLKRNNEINVRNFLSVLSVNGLYIGGGLSVAALVSRASSGKKQQEPHDEDEKSKSN